ncbi:MAG TPA: PepSY domain-containing protein [Planctomycetes bacterium]|nr:PepSY domain-containing protein [Planctomycetota bacterium]HIL37874.1 PepSY domain-containing protein [Planctomycetota bacterium]
MSAAKWNRKIHRLGAVIAALPLLVILTSGVILQLKGELDWIRPPTLEGTSGELSLPWARVLEIAQGVPEAEVSSWSDIERLDVRPINGMLKVRCKNRWEIQVDSASGIILSSTLRRSDWIESIHDGSWFHDSFKLWVFLPAGLILGCLWATGVYLWLLPHLFRRRRKIKA